MVIGVWVGLHALHWGWSTAECVALHADYGIVPDRVAAAWRTLDGPAREGWLRRFLEQGVIPLGTYAWLHMSVVGVLFDSVFLWTMGGRLESRAGAGRFAVLLAGAALAVGVVEVWLGPEGARARPAMGGSGVTGAVVAAYLLRHFRSRVSVLVPVVVVPACFTVSALLLAVVWAAARFEPLQTLLAHGDARPPSYLALLAGVAVGILAAGPLYLGKDKVGGRPEARSGSPRKRKRK